MTIKTCSECKEFYDPWPHDVSVGRCLLKDSVNYKKISHLRRGILAKNECLFSIDHAENIKFISENLAGIVNRNSTLFNEEILPEDIRLIDLLRLSTSKNRLAYLNQMQ